jgi:hypothetical protein
LTKQVGEAGNRIKGNRMTFQEIWRQLCRKRPLLSDPDSTVEFKSVNLKSLLRQAYEQGEKAGRVAGGLDAAGRTSNNQASDGNSSHPLDFLNGIFNKR